MKKYVSLFLSVMLMFIVSACTSDDGLETSKAEMNEGQWHHTTMSLGISKESFEAKGSASTRAISDEWQDGDKLYLRFVTYYGVQNGTAIYDGKKGMWNVSYQGKLNKNVESQLFVIFLDNVETENSAQDGVIPLDCYHGVFMDEHGTYLYDPDEDNLAAKATLKSLTSRVRFKGDTPDMDFKVIGFTYYTGYNVQNHSFTTGSDIVRTKTKADSQSDYIYVQQLTAENRQIVLGRTYEEGNYTFKEICNDKMFVVGKSGIITIPNKTQYSGWSKKQVSGVDEDGHGWVDLDLPSGTIWCTENYGADWEEYKKTGDGNNLIGAVCLWGSIDFTNPSQSTTDIGGTDEDIVTVAWGKKWRTPSWENAEELINNTTRSGFQEGYFGNVSAYVWTGKNDETIVMPLQERWVINSLWTSTPRYGDRIYLFRVDGSWYDESRSAGATEIRPVMVK